MGGKAHRQTGLIGLGGGGGDKHAGQDPLSQTRFGTPAQRPDRIFHLRYQCCKVLMQNCEMGFFPYSWVAATDRDPYPYPPLVLDVLDMWKKERE